MPEPVLLGEAVAQQLKAERRRITDALYETRKHWRMCSSRWGSLDSRKVKEKIRPDLRRAAQRFLRALSIRMNISVGVQIKRHTGGACLDHRIYGGFSGLTWKLVLDGKITTAVDAVHHEITHSPMFAGDGHIRFQSWSQ